MRILLARLLYDQHNPISAQDMEDALVTADRSTISRTLTLFLAKGLVHAIDDGSASVKYELCRDLSEDTRHSDLHPHFHCRRCGRTFCLNSFSFPEISVPDAFRAETANYVITGLCPRCSSAEA